MKFIPVGYVSALLYVCDESLHSPNLQVLYGPLYKEGIGLENGEFTELVNVWW